MLTGIRYKAYPTDEQAQTLAKWMGCARTIWNAKCDEDQYLRTYARKYLPIGTFPKPDQTYAQYKGEHTEYLRHCPSQLLRNSASIWYQTYQKFLKGECGRPVRKKRGKGDYLWLTRELFRLEQHEGQWRLFIGTQRNNIGYLTVNWHRKPKNHQLPNSIWLKRINGAWTASFSYENGLDSPINDTQAHLDWLRNCTENHLEQMITPLDRGIQRPVQTHDTTYKPDEKTLRKQQGRDRYIRACQRKLARQQTGSNRSKLTKTRIAKLHQKTAYVREDFLHKTSRRLVDSSRVIVMEALKLKNMTRRPKANKNEKTGRWEKNHASQKAGLNRALLGVGLYKLEVFIQYKADRAGKPVFKVNPINTSRECAACGHIHPDNRQTQADFRCIQCGHTDNADRNAALVIRKRAIQLILDSGTELAGRNKNVLRPGTGANRIKTMTGQSGFASGCPSKKTVAGLAQNARLAA